MGEERWEYLVNHAWLSGSLNRYSFNEPNKYPESPSELLKKSEPKKAMTIKEWSAVVSGITGRPINLEKMGATSPED